MTDRETLTLLATSSWVKFAAILSYFRRKEKPGSTMSPPFASILSNMTLLGVATSPQIVSSIENAINKYRKTAKYSISIDK